MSYYDKMFTEMVMDAYSLNQRNKYFIIKEGRILIIK
jgi:hypothetical protein